MMKNIFVLLAIISYSYGNPHNIGTFTIPNFYLAGQQNIHQLIPTVAQWPQTQIPARISSSGARFDQFIQYLNVPATQLSVANVPVRTQQFAIPSGVHFSVPSASNKAILSYSVPQANTFQQSIASVPHQLSSGIPPNKSPINFNTPSTNLLDSRYITQFAQPTKATTTNRNHNNAQHTPTGVLFNAPAPSDDQNVGQSFGSMVIQPPKLPINNNGQSFPTNTVIPGNANGQSFPTNTVIPGNGNGQNFPINTALPNNNAEKFPTNSFSPSLFNSPQIPNKLPNPSVAVSKLYDSPITGSDSVQNIPFNPLNVQNTNSYNSPSIVSGATQHNQNNN